MSKTKFIFVIVLAFLAGIAGAWVFSAGIAGKGPVGAENSTKESAFERVMRTQTIRCGYIVWPPVTIKDVTTGKLSGVFPDYVEALGAALHLKIDWAEEVGSGDYGAALEAGRIDAMCGGIWPNAPRARVMDFTRPVSFQPNYAFARAGDTRFDDHLERIDDPSVTIATMDGAMSSLIAANDFPKAKTAQLPQLRGSGETLVNVAAGKADVALLDPGTAAQYEGLNPGKIRRVPAGAPLRVFGNTIALTQGEDKLRRMLDTATQELLASGQVEKILAKYEQTPGIFLRVAPGYQAER